MRSGRFAKILVFEKNLVLRAKIATALSPVGGVSMMMMTGDFDMAVNSARGCRPDILMMDIEQAVTFRMRLASLVEENPDIRIVLYGDNAADEYRKCGRELGAAAVVEFMDLVGAVGPMIEELADANADAKEYAR